MPLIEDDPPITLPRGTASRRPFRCGSGSVRNPQSYSGMFIGIEKAAGIWISGPMSLPPRSSTMTACRPSALSRSASTQPAEPAPTMT